MTSRKRFLIAGACVAALAAGGVGIAAATGGGDDSEQPITGSALDQAKAAALAETGGGGTVTETETGDEESFYEVEVTREDGSQVDVQLDRDFNVVGSAADDESEDEPGEQ